MSNNRDGTPDRTERRWARRLMVDGHKRTEDRSSNLACECVVVVWVFRVDEEVARECGVWMKKHDSPAFWSFLAIM